jgi:hypothetical protein
MCGDELLLTATAQNLKRLNTLDHRAKDVSEDIAAEIQTRLDMEGNELPEHIRDFIESHRHSTRQLSLRLA